MCSTVRVGHSFLSSIPQTVVMTCEFQIEFSLAAFLIKSSQTTISAFVSAARETLKMTRFERETSKHRIRANEKSAG